MKVQSDISALVGSRICHDLINPLGAIGNGVELLELTGIAQSPEMSLIADSISAAQARLRFFGIAFGAAEPGLLISRADICATLGAIARGGRLSYDWQGESDVSRQSAKAVFLLLQCLETAMPFGGTISIRQDAAGWDIVAKAARIALDDRLWAGLQGQTSPQVSAAQVQFALLPSTLAAMDRILTLNVTPGRIAARF
jgi:histidine phosphotransferase ChpT